MRIASYLKINTSNVPVNSFVLYIDVLCMFMCYHYNDEVSTLPLLGIYRTCYGRVRSRYFGWLPWQQYILKCYKSSFEMFLAWTSIDIQNFVRLFQFLAKICKFLCSKYAILGGKVENLATLCYKKYL